MAVQGSLLDVGEQPRLAASLSGRVRTDLGLGAWLEVCRGFLRGSGTLFDVLVRDVPWTAESRWMYSRVVEVPRLTAHYGPLDRLPDPLLGAVRDELSAWYESDLGEPLSTVGLCLYRDGADSVAWHGDTKGRGASGDTVVAIVSLGATRPFLLRRRGGGPSTRFMLEAGDLIVMGGSCQRTFEHAVPKTARPIGPRVSVQFRPRGVR